MQKITKKKFRVLDIFYRLIKGEYISPINCANEYDVSTKTISRDINEIKDYISERQGLIGGISIIYSKKEKSYYLEKNNFLSSKELLALAEILIASRSFPRENMALIIEKLKNFTSMHDKKLIHDFISKELYHYKPVGTDCENVIDNLWSISQSIEQQQEITITYYKMDRTIITRKIRPESIVFSDYYFYLIASHNKEGRFVNRFYRIDRITNIKKHKENFKIEYSNRFDEGNLKNEIQYMWPGNDEIIVFEFTGPSVQAILDKLPKSEIIKREGNKYTIRAKVYGSGIRMFLLSQGEWVKVLEPDNFVSDFKSEIERMYHSYFH